MIWNNNINLANDFGRTPLHWAALEGDLGKIKRKLRSFQLNGIFFDSGDAEIVDLLIKNGANVNAVDHTEKTPLQKAVEKSNFRKILPRIINEQMSKCEFDLRI